jgi:hypothetical protein
MAVDATEDLREQAVGRNSCNAVTSARGPFDSDSDANAERPPHRTNLYIEQRNRFPNSPEFGLASGRRPVAHWP